MNKKGRGMSLYMKDGIYYKIYIDKYMYKAFTKVFDNPKPSMEKIKFVLKNNKQIDLTIIKYEDYSTDFYVNLSKKEIGSDRLQELAIYEHGLTSLKYINKSVYHLKAFDSNEYYVKIFYEDLDNYNKAKKRINDALNDICVNDDYWYKLYFLNPANETLLLDFCFELLINSEYVYNISGYREALKSKFEYYGINLNTPQNIFAKAMNKKSVQYFIDLISFEIIDDQNELSILDDEDLKNKTNTRQSRDKMVKEEVTRLYLNNISYKKYTKDVLYL